MCTNRQNSGKTVEKWHIQCHFLDKKGCAWVTVGSMIMSVGNRG
jgi:hypothetical protein